jgi:hypothetical protein
MNKEPSSKLADFFRAQDPNKKRRLDSNGDPDNEDLQFELSEGGTVK